MLSGQVHELLPHSADELKGKVAVITGASSGIGLATACLMAKAGAMLLSENEQKLKEVEDKMKQEGLEKCCSVVCDVRDPDQVEKTMKQLADHHDGKIDILFANAGINGVWAPLDDLKVSEIDNTMNVNLRGAFLTLKFAVPFLKNSDCASVIFNSSVTGTRIFSNWGSTADAVSNAGILCLAKMTALELAKHNIRVNVVCPGQIETAIEQSMQTRNLGEIELPVKYDKGTIPLSGGKAGKAEDVAETVLFLASARARHITGTPVWIDGGESLLRG